MSRVELVTVSEYQAHQYTSLVREYRALFDAGLDEHAYLDAARIKWGCSYDDAILAIREAEGL